MKYSQLSPQAQLVAQNDYILGWLETHNETLSPKEAHNACLDTDTEIAYNQKGEMQNA